MPWGMYLFVMVLMLIPLSIVLWTMIQQKNQSQAAQNLLTQEIERLRVTNQDLLNRVQSRDWETYSRLKGLSEYSEIPEGGPIPRGLSDEVELERIGHPSQLSETDINDMRDLGILLPSSEI